MKKQFKLLSSILAALTVISASSITFAAPKNNNKVPVYKKVFKYGLISAGVTAAAALTAVGAYKLFSPKDKIETTHEENKTACEEKVIEINSKEDFKQIKKCGDTITKAIINVEYIPPLAFVNCFNLKEVDLSNVKNIDCLSFGNCRNLEIINNSSNVEVISKWAFTNCNALKELDLPKAKKVFESAFLSCESLKRLNLPNIQEIVVTTLDNGEWLNYRDLKSFKDSIFQNCPSLEEINLSKNVKMQEWT